MQYKVTVTHMAFEDEPKNVADVDIPHDMPSLSRSDRNKMLSYAFKMTNHIDTDWTKNCGITMLTPGSARSTSVGDRMRLWVRKGNGNGNKPTVSRFKDVVERSGEGLVTWYGRYNGRFYFDGYALQTEFLEDAEQFVTSMKAYEDETLDSLGTWDHTDNLGRGYIVAWDKNRFHNIDDLWKTYGTYDVANFGFEEVLTWK
ncbi:MAG: hypothetical protein CMF29_08460 [Kiritimatiellaceae bacterium]|nr:hypothetical protein [Kiritimatiellaceae bacterium]